MITSGSGSSLVARMVNAYVQRTPGATLSSTVNTGLVEYLEAVVRERRDWSDFYRACRDLSG